MPNLVETSSCRKLRAVARCTEAYNVASLSASTLTNSTQEIPLRSCNIKHNQSQDVYDEHRASLLLIEFAGKTNGEIERVTRTTGLINVFRHHTPSESGGTSLPSLFCLPLHLLRAFWAMM